jgi:hypothetical protein
MAQRSSLRAADSDREAVTERLRKAAGEGRLEPEELEDRVDAALRARTYGDLDLVLADLPSGRALVPAAQTALAAATQVAVTLVVVTLVLAKAALTVAWWLVHVVLRAHGYAAGRLGAQPGRPAA